MIASRRSFLIGFGAALAATQLPRLPSDEVVRGVITDMRLGERSIFEILLGVTDPIENATALHWWIGREGDELPHLDLAMSAQSVLRWVSANDDSMIYLPKTKPLKLTCEPAIRGATVHLSSVVNGQNFMEQYEFNGNKFIAHEPVLYSLSPPVPIVDAADYDDEDYDSDVYDEGEAA